MQNSTQSRAALFGLTLAASMFACKPSGGIGGAGGSGGGSDSIVASIPGIDNGLRAAIKLTFTLNCDPNQNNLANAAQKISAVDNQNPGNTNVTFAGTSAVHVNDWCAMLVTDPNASDPSLSHYQWTSANKQVGLFFGSAPAQLSATRTLALTLYTVYIDTNAPHFTPSFTVTLPAGASNGSPATTSGGLTCNGNVQTSNQATALGSNMISYIFPLPTAQFATAQTCDMSATTSSGTYSAKGVVSVISTTTQYSNINLQVAPPPTTNGSGSAINVTVQSGSCATAFNPVTMSCAAAPATPAPTPTPSASGTVPATPAPTVATTGVSGTIQVASNPPPANAAPTPVGAQGLWLDDQTDPDAPFPTSQYACKGAAIINESKMQIGLGYYCWLLVAQGSLQPGSFVVDIEYFGNITSEANNELDFNNTNVGCDISSFNQPLYTDFQLQTIGNSASQLALSVGDVPEYMGHWQNSPNLSSGIPIGCIDQGTGTFHQNDTLQAALLPMMVY